MVEELGLGLEVITSKVLQQRVALQVSRNQGISSNQFDRYEQRRNNWAGVTAPRTGVVQQRRSAPSSCTRDIPIWLERITLTPNMHPSLPGAINVDRDRLAEVIAFCIQGGQLRKTTRGDEAAR